MTRNGLTAVAVFMVLGMSAHAADAQWERGDDDWCERSRSDRNRSCLVLERGFEPTRSLAVDGGMNGGITVEGWERDRVEVRARVWANAGSMARAEELAEAVDVRMERGRLSAEGPRADRHESWGVSWDIRVPRSSDLTLETSNGGIGVTAVDGAIRFEAVNGGVTLADVAGDVSGRTTNGGLHIELAGDRWQGEGLDVATVNGGVTLVVPEDFSAELETATVNGRIDIDFPVTVQGRLGRRLMTTLGDGGPRVRAVTTNGSVKIQRGRRVLR